MSSLNPFRILFIGDIVGRPGREIIKKNLPTIRHKHGIHCVIANGENAAGGSGITQAIAEELIQSGIDAITLGDHVWDHSIFQDQIDGLDYVCRPANLPDTCPGRTYLILEKDGFKLGIINLLGRQFMNTLRADCPFKAADALITHLQDKTQALFVDIHAEATSEKVALGWYLDGRVSAVVGTHTHIPTADSRVLPQGTAYMTDAGMTGAYHSVIGRDIQPIIARFLDSMPRKAPVATEDVKISGCMVSINRSHGKAMSIEHFIY